MNKHKVQKGFYAIGIGLGIIFVTAFLFGQVLLPFAIGRPEKVKIPDVVGMILAQAKRVLAEDKLHVVIRDSLYSETAKIDHVLEQTPSAGSLLKEEGTVFLVVSKGSKMVTVPDILGTSFQDAMIILRNHNLRSTVVDSVYSDSVARNAVLRSVPAPGTKVERQTLVRLSLSRGPEIIPDSLDAIDRYFQDWEY